MKLLVRHTFSAFCISMFMFGENLEAMHTGAPDASKKMIDYIEECLNSVKKKFETSTFATAWDCFNTDNKSNVATHIYRNHRGPSCKGKSYFECYKKDSNKLSELDLPTCTLLVNNIPFYFEIINTYIGTSVHSVLPALHICAKIKDKDGFCRVRLTNQDSIYCFDTNKKITNNILIIIKCKPTKFINPTMYYTYYIASIYPL